VRKLVDSKLFYKGTKRIRARAFDLQRKEMIGTRSAEVDRRDGFAHLVGPLAEPES
jgi:hypothetical protein